MDISKKRLGLSLSGGGYRAAAFHLGTLKKLDEMGVLEKVDVMSTISGGSITGAAYCLHNGSYSEFHSYMREKLEGSNVIGFLLKSGATLLAGFFVLAFLALAVYFLFRTNYPWLSFVVLALMLFLFYKFQFRIWPVSTVIENAYDSFLFEGKTLKQLNEKPLLAIGSSNIQTGRPFTFSRKKMGDSTYSFYKPPIYFLHENFPVSRAVMASSCVPFAFSPVSIDKKFFRIESDFERIDPKLIDGGVYDNQGIQKITQKGSSYECDLIVTSDAGAGMGLKGSYDNTLALLIRTVDVFMKRIKSVQMEENLYDNSGKPIAYFSLGWRIENCIDGFIRNMENKTILLEVLHAHSFPQLWIDDPKEYKEDIRKYLMEKTGYLKIAARDLSRAEWVEACKTATNLTPLKKRRVDLLIRQAENLAELQLKLYLPMVLSRKVVNSE